MGLKKKRKIVSIQGHLGVQGPIGTTGVQLLLSLRTLTLTLHFRVEYLRDSDYSSK